jgi:hypothetical protein
MWVLAANNDSAVAMAPAVLRKLLRFNSVFLTEGKLAAVCNHTTVTPRETAELSTPLRSPRSDARSGVEGSAVFFRDDGGRKS